MKLCLARNAQFEQLANSFKKLVIPNSLNSDIVTTYVGRSDKYQRAIWCCNSYIWPFTWLAPSPRAFRPVKSLKKRCQSSRGSPNSRPIRVNPWVNSQSPMAIVFSSTEEFSYSGRGKPKSLFRDQSRNVLVAAPDVDNQIYTTRNAVLI